MLWVFHSGPGRSASAGLSSPRPPRPWSSSQTVVIVAIRTRRIPGFRPTPQPPKPNPRPPWARSRLPTPSRSVLRHPGRKVVYYLAPHRSRQEDRLPVGGRTRTTQCLPTSTRPAGYTEAPHASAQPGTPCRPRRPTHDGRGNLMLIRTGLRSVAGWTYRSTGHVSPPTTRTSMARGAAVIGALMTR